MATTTAKDKIQVAISNSTQSPLDPAKEAQGTGGGVMEIESDDIAKHAASESDSHDVRVKPAKKLNTSISPNSPNTERTITLTNITKAINTCNSSVNILAHNLEGMREDINPFRQDMQTIMKSEKKNTQQLSLYDSRLEDLENHLRRNNIRGVGLPKRAEGNKPVEFIERWLKDTMGTEYFSPLFSVEQAHRVAARSPSLGEHLRSRTFIFKVLNYKDRNTILQRARQLADIRMNGLKIRFFRDFSANVQRQRAGFMDVKRRLRQMDFSYAMLFPAKLKVMTQDKTLFFTSPDSVSQWLDSHQRLH